MVRLVLAFALVLTGLGLLLMVTPGPGAMLFFPGAVIVVAASALLMARRRRDVP